MATREKERLCNVLEAMERRLTVIDDMQAEMVGGFENMRASMHEIKNAMTVIKNMMPEFERMLETDANEIKSILQKLDSLSTKIVSREDVVRSMIREKNNG